MPVDKSTLLKGQGGRTHRPCRQKYASGEPDWAHPPPLSTKLRSWRTRLGAPTVPVDKSTLLKGQGGRTHRPCRQKQLLEMHPGYWDHAETLRNMHLGYWDHAATHRNMHPGYLDHAETRRNIHPGYWDHTETRRNMHAG